MELSDKKNRRNELRLEIGARLREVRKYCGYTQTKMAHLSKYKRSLIGQVETGLCTANIDLLLEYVKHCNTSISYLIEGDTTKQYLPNIKFCPNCGGSLQEFYPK